MKLEIYRRELNEYNMVGACGYVVNAKRPTTAVRRFTKAVKESNKLNEVEKERIIEFVEDEKVFVEMLEEAGSTNAHDKEWSIDLEEIEEGYWYVSVSASVEKENQEEETVETPSAESNVDKPNEEEMLKMKELNMVRVTSTYNNIMVTIGCDHLTIGYGENTDNWNLRDMVAECDYQLNTFYDYGHCNNELKEYDYKEWLSETSRLKRFIKNYWPYTKEMKCYEGHCSKYD